jgi:hypothetical protein
MLLNYNTNKNDILMQETMIYIRIYILASEFDHQISNMAYDKMRIKFYDLILNHNGFEFAKAFYLNESNYEKKYRLIFLLGMFDKRFFISELKELKNKLTDTIAQRSINTILNEEMDSIEGHIQKRKAFDNQLIAKHKKLFGEKRIE